MIQWLSLIVPSAGPADFDRHKQNFYMGTQLIRLVNLIATSEIHCTNFMLQSVISFLRNANKCVFARWRKKGWGRNETSPLILVIQAIYRFSVFISTAYHSLFYFNPKWRTRQNEWPLTPSQIQRAGITLWSIKEMERGRNTKISNQYQSLPKHDRNSADIPLLFPVENNINSGYKKGFIRVVKTLLS